MRTTTLNEKRFRASLLLKGRGFQDAADAAEVSYQHLRYVLRGERAASRRLLVALRTFLGDSSWQWITGASDTLNDAPQSSAA